MFLFHIIGAQCALHIWNLLRQIFALNPLKVEINALRKYFVCCSGWYVGGMCIFANGFG